MKRSEWRGEQGVYSTPDEMLQRYVSGEQYHVFEGATPNSAILTVCCLTFRNGFVVTGESKCDFVDEYDEEVQRRAAHAGALVKAWPLIEFHVREKTLGPRPV